MSPAGRPDSRGPPTGRGAHSSSRRRRGSSAAFPAPRPVRRRRGDGARDRRPPVPGFAQGRKRSRGERFETAQERPAVVGQPCQYRVRFCRLAYGRCVNARTGCASICIIRTRILVYILAYNEVGVNSQFLSHTIWRTGEEEWGAPLGRGTPRRRGGKWKLSPRFVWRSRPFATAQAPMQSPIEIYRTIRGRGTPQAACNAGATVNSMAPCSRFWSASMAPHPASAAGLFSVSRARCLRRHHSTRLANTAW